MKKHDIKTSHVTVIDKEKRRETFTSGFYRNVSHSGISAAKTVQHDIAKMAVITNCEYDDMMTYIDFNTIQYICRWFSKPNASDWDKTVKSILLLPKHNIRQIFAHNFFPVHFHTQVPF